MADYGIKISKAGFSVLTAADDDMAFSSKFSLFKEYMSGIGSATVGIEKATVATIAHNLGYKPVFFIFADEPNVSANYQGVYRRPNNNAGFFQCVYGQAKNNTLEIIIDNTGGPGTGGTFNYKYFIMVDRGGT